MTVPKRLCTTVAQIIWVNVIRSKHAKQFQMVLET